MKFLPSQKRLALLLVCGWMLATGWGMWKLTAYSFDAGSQGPAPGDWPADASLIRTPRSFNAVLALHPECPCSQATLEELDSLMAQAAGRLEANLLFVELPGLPAADESDLWRRASRIAGVRLIKDPEGAEARRFGALTSGETRVYGVDGHLAFHGGITRARGHAGDNLGKTAILAMLRDGVPANAPISTPVFGCSL